MKIAMRGEELNTEAYKVTLNIAIKNIDKIVNIHNNHKTYWSTIYNVIQQEFVDENEIFLCIFRTPQ